MGRKRPVEQVAGLYSAVPHSVLDSVAFTGASYRAKALLYEIIRQLNGSNNGHLQLATSWLKKRGWPSVDAVQKAKLELAARQLIVKTRLGGLNAGPDMWAVTWLTISNFVGLDICKGQHIPGTWHYFIEPEKQKKRSVKRKCAVPPIGFVTPSAAPCDGAKTAPLSTTAIPSHGNNVCTNEPGKKSRKRIVGKPGKSGRNSAALKLASTAHTH